MSTEGDTAVFFLTTFWLRLNSFVVNSKEFPGEQIILLSILNISLVCFDFRNQHCTKEEFYGGINVNHVFSIKRSYYQVKMLHFGTSRT